MTRDGQQILEQALMLPADDRAALADRLLQSLNPEVDAAWAEEVRRRIAEVESGETKLIPWEQVRAELDEQLHDTPK